MSGRRATRPYLVTRGNLHKAAAAANVESLITAGTGLVNSRGTADVIDFFLSVAGLASDSGCGP